MKKYYATLSRNGTEDEIAIYTPDDRAMLCVAFWDARDCDAGSENAAQLKADAKLIVDALNAYRPGRTKTLPADPEDMNVKRASWADAAIRVFREETGTDFEDALADLLCDLMHWADRASFDFDAALDRARCHYEAETATEAA